MPTLTAQVPREFLTAVDSVAKDLERSRAWVIKDALRDYLARHLRDQQRWQDTVEAIAAADRGEVVAADEVFAWLDTWGREEEAAD